MKCNKCEKEMASKATKSGAERLPRGWHRNGDAVECAECWKGAYLLRAITIPIAGPVSCEWPQLREMLSAGWSATTEMANWATRELAKADIVRGPGMAKMPAMERTYLYPGARKLRPDLSPQSVVSVLQAAERKYRAKRYETIWTSAASLPNFRYPTPLPVHNQGWSVVRTEAGEYHVTFAVLQGQKVTVRLRGGHHFRRQLKAIDKLIQGVAMKGELAIYRLRASSGDHRPGVEDRAPGGGARVAHRIMAKLVLWLPREEAHAAEERTLELRTDPSSFWVAEIESLPPWILNADHVRRWIAEHRERLQRMGEDGKWEKRWPKRMRAQMQDNREAWVTKQRRRLTTWKQQATASVLAYSKRHRITRLEYSDHDRSFVPSYPWADLKTWLKEKCDEARIVFVDVPKVPDMRDGIDSGVGAPEMEEEGAAMQ